MMAAKRSAGFSMIEVLIAVLILAIGLLGVAALQMASLDQGQESYFRSQATALADDLAGRIRSNRHMVVHGAPPWGAPLYSEDPVGAVTAYGNLFVASPYDCGDPPPTNCRDDEILGEADALGCSMADQIAFDQWEVCNQAETLLPDGQVHVAANGARITVGVSWLAVQPREDSGENTEAPIRNPVCNEVFGLDAVTRDCVLVESIP